MHAVCLLSGYHSESTVLDENTELHVDLFGICERLDGRGGLRHCTERRSGPAADVLSLLAEPKMAVFIPHAIIYIEVNSINYPLYMIPELDKFKLCDIDKLQLKLKELRATAQDRREYLDTLSSVLDRFPFLFGYFHQQLNAFPDDVVSIEKKIQFVQA